MSVFCLLLQINHQSLDNFLSKLELGYSKFGNPYHNLLHGADVAQTAATVCSQSGLMVSTSSHIVPWRVTISV